MTPQEIDAEMERLVGIWLAKKLQQPVTVTSYDVAGNVKGEQPERKLTCIERREAHLRGLRAGRQRTRAKRVPVVEDTDAPFISVRVAARYASVTPRTVYNWVEEGKLPYRRLPNGRVRVEKAALLKVPAICAVSSAIAS